MQSSTKHITQLGLLLALAYLGSLLKIPTPVGSTAFDSAPAYFSGLLLGGGWGALVGGLAHLLTATLSGLPFGLPVHLQVAAGMAISVWLFAACWPRSRALAVLVALSCNGVLLPLSLLCWPSINLALAISLMPGLLLATALNLLVAVGIRAAWRTRGV